MITNKKDLTAFYNVKDKDAHRLEAMPLQVVHCVKGTACKRQGQPSIQCL